MTPENKQSDIERELENALQALGKNLGLLNDEQRKKILDELTPDARRLRLDITTMLTGVTAGPDCDQSFEIHGLLTQEEIIVRHFLVRATGKPDPTVGELMIYLKGKNDHQIKMDLLMSNTSVASPNRVDERVWPLFLQKLRRLGIEITPEKK